MTDLEVTARVAERGLHAELVVAAGQVVALIGPNGAGKSTLAGVVAGVVRADDAVVRVGSRVLTDTGRRIGVAIHQRRVGLLEQDPLLFPHMSVRDNVAFAARRRLGRAAARASADRWLDQVGAGDLAPVRPRGLSGGQAQRVALARALAAEPDVLILDEPLSGLDVGAAARVRSVLGPVLSGGSRPVLLITHDLLDVLAFADRVVVLDDGRVAEQGRVAEVLSAPRSRFGARFAGLNLVRGRVAGAGVLTGDAGQDWHGTSPADLPPGSEAVAVFSPGAVAVFRERPEGSPRNSVRLPIAGLEAGPAAIRVRADPQPDGSPGIAADVTVDAVAELRLQPGQPVWFTVKTQAVTLHAAVRPR